jgi:phage gp16-like protein
VRNALLAKAHIAKKELLHDDEALYRGILRDEFGVGSAAELSGRELEQLVERFEADGWRPSAKRGTGEPENRRGQVEALKERIGQELLHSLFTERRLRGLVKKICGVDDLRFARDAAQLKRLLAAITRIKRHEAEGGE